MLTHSSETKLLTSTVVRPSRPATAYEQATASIGRANHQRRSRPGTASPLTRSHPHRHSTTQTAAKQTPLTTVAPKSGNRDGRTRRFRCDRPAPWSALLRIDRPRRTSQGVTCFVSTSAGAISRTSGSLNSLIRYGS
jgi:hypothetical protein